MMVQCLFNTCSILVQYLFNTCYVREGEEGDKVFGCHRVCA